MRFGSATLLVTLVALSATAGRAFSDAAVIDGFNRTVFGSEHPAWSLESGVVKKFPGAVRFYVDDRSAAHRGGDVEAFIRSLPGLIAGLDATLVASPRQANFRVYVLDRADYRAVVANEVFNRPASGFAPGKCLVRVVSGRGRIFRADAVIVADEGEFLFRRCIVEEVLQGLGPLNDDPGLPESVFNDRSRHAAFTPFDRSILNMLYHPSVKAGMSRAEVNRVLPAIAAELRNRR